MPRELPSIGYRPPSPRPDRWQLWHAIDSLAIGCFAAALYCGLLSFVLSAKFATPTPAYRQFQQSMRAQAATRPAGTVFQYPPFTGREYEPRPLWSLSTTWLALGFAGAGVALFVRSARQFRRV
jgi:hypothetical protein